MKKLYFLQLLLFLASYSYAQTLTLDSFYKPGAVWTEYLYSIHMPKSCVTYRSSGGVQYRVDSVKSINNLSYFFISSRYNGSLNVNTWEFTVTNYPWVNLGRLRVDSNKVYFTRDSGNNYCYGCYYEKGVEKLVYDFGIKVGDTLPYTMQYFTSQKLISIDSVMLNTGQYVKRFNFQSGLYWLYGIGADFFIGSYTAIFGGPHHYTDGQALCYQNNTILYKYDIQSYTGLTWDLANSCFDVSVLEVNTIKKDINLDLYPNPLDGSDLFIKYDQSQDIHTISVNDAVGRLQQTFTGQDVKQSQKLHLPLPAGIYFVRIEMEDKTIITRKIIKN